MAQKNRKKIINSSFEVLDVLFLRAEGFSCRLETGGVELMRDV